MLIGTIDEQIRLEKQKEEEGRSKVIRDLNKAIKRNDYSSTPYGMILVKLGYQSYVDILTTYMNTKFTVTYYKKEQDLLKLMSEDVEEIAYVVLTTIISYTIHTPGLTNLSINIVERLRDIFLFNKLEVDNPKLHTYLGSRFRKASKYQREKLVKKHIEDLYKLGDTKEDKALMLRIGSRLISMLENSGANVIEIFTLRHGKNKTANAVRFTEEANHIILNISPEDFVSNNTNKLPMIVPPRDWSTPFNGGFYKGRNFMFTTHSSDVAKFLKNNKYDKLYPIINKLQRTPWRVNRKVADVIEYIFNNDVIDPKSPTMARTLLGGLPTNNILGWKDLIKEEEFDTWYLFNRAREDIKIRNTAAISKRMDLLYALSVVHQVRDYEKIYYPYMFDYRGRVYSKVNFLTPQGIHYVKAMLEFGEGKYLDTNGVHWLKIHTANVYGMDKLPYNERIEWFDNNYDMIVRVGTSPLEYTADWVWCDSPFEFIAACIAFKDHLSGEMVYLPIQLDATCSGIQMYSGLLRDKPGAEAVNVIGSSRNDIYQIVADKVNNYLEEGDYPKVIEYTDREGKEHSVFTYKEAKSLIGTITRSLVKTNVMTVPYSVTMRGMSDQIWDKMDEAILQGKPFWEGDKWIVNKLITHLDHKAIYDTIDGARLGQEYLVELSKCLTEPATWYGPLYDFPVRQTSLDTKAQRVKTIYGSLVLTLEVPKLNRRRQRNAIAPNFIHNIDSTILLHVIENLDQHIGVIHDCFLAHPNDGYELQDAYRAAFIEVMKADPLRLIQQQLDPEGVVDFPEYGELDLDEVKHSKYIIS